MLVQGKEYWRIAGAILKENWFLRMNNSAARVRAARICHLLLRLVAGETRDVFLFPIINSFFDSLASLPEEKHEEIEIITALRILTALGLDTGEIPEEISPKTRTSYIRRINRGIEASGL